MDNGRRARKNSVALHVPPIHLNARRSMQREKIGTSLSIAGATCICLGLAWTLCYLYFGRGDLSLVFVALMAVGIFAVCRIKRADANSLLIVAHGIFFAVSAIALFDAPIAWVPRSVHLFLLPLAAGLALTFEARERYGSLFFPLACLGMFSAFAIGAFDSLAPGVSPPLEVRAWGARLNAAFSMALLATIFAIYRNDIGKRLRMERDLRRAVRKGEIEVHYQPQLLNTGVVTGVEALVRWRHPSGILLSPGIFIPLAEESALICEVGLEVLRQACETLRYWSNDPATSTLRMAVNISPVQLLDEDFFASVSAAIRSSGVDPKLLEFELTESALSTDAASVTEKMMALERMGVAWALDDFGTGYSSLSTLRALPVRKLKIDRRFLDEAVRQEGARRLLGKIVEISHVMDMSALAEGVETVEQRDLLVGLGCYHFQGYFFAHPMTRAALKQWLDERQTSIPTAGEVDRVEGSIEA